MGIVERYGESYRDDQLAVELRDTALVMRELLAMNVVLANPGPPPASADLGLALIDLSNLAAGVRPLRDDPDLVAAAATARAAPYRRDDPLPDIDLLLFALRQRFRARYDGWVPTIGKNRPLAQIEGWPYIKGASGVLNPVSGPRIPARDGTPGPRVGILDTRIFAHPDRLGPDVVVVAAAGNHGELGRDPDPDTGLTGRTPIWPAALDGVVAVGAHDGHDPAHPTAGFSPHRAPWVDLLAPGVDEESTFLTGDVSVLVRQEGKLVVEDTVDFAAGYATWRGTS